VLEGFDAATHARGPDMERTLRRSAGALGATADLAAQLNADGAALRSLVSNGRRVVEAIGQSPGSLGAMAESVDGLMRTTAARQADLAIATTRAPRSLRSTRQTLDRLGASVDDLHGLMRDGRPAAAELRRIAPELRDLVIDAAPALARARELVGDGPADLQRLQPLLKAARPVLDTLVPILRDTLPMANQLRAHAPDWFSFWSGWGSYASPYDANGHGARVGLVLANPPRNVITPGSGAPGRLDPPFVRTPGALQSEPWRDYADSFLEGDK
jgi:ABC-type transporter Mla subunit MlaD